MKKLVVGAIAVIGTLCISIPLLKAQSTGEWEKVAESATSVVFGNGLYVVRPPNGDIFYYVGRHPEKKIGGPGKSFVIAGDKLYGISPDGSGVYEFTGTPGQWKKVGGPAQAIYGRGGSNESSKLFATNPQTGDIYSYDSSGQWTKIGGPGKMFATDGVHLYGLSPDGSAVYRYDETPGNWVKVGGAAAEIYGGGGYLYATNPQTGDVYRFLSHRNSWEKVGGPGRMFAVDSYGKLYGLSPDGNSVHMYTPGNPAGKWEQIGGPAGKIYAGGAQICATNPVNQELWCGQFPKITVGGPPPTTPPPTTPPPIIIVEINLIPGSFNQLRVSGGVFSAGEQVDISVTTSVNGQSQPTEITPTKADSSGRINQTISVGCPAGAITVFKVQARGVSSKKVSNSAGASC
jgi:hypothetical protein